MEELTCAVDAAARAASEVVATAAEAAQSVNDSGDATAGHIIDDAVDSAAATPTVDDEDDAEELRVILATAEDNVTLAIYEACATAHDHDRQDPRDICIPYVCRDSFICATKLMHEACTHSYVRQSSCMRRAS